jgi:DNA-binding response OmpR family regulator
MRSSRSFNACFCQCTHDSARMSSLLEAAGYSVIGGFSLPALVQILSESRHSDVDLIVSSVDEGGLAVAHMLDQLELADPPALILVDRAHDLSSAIKALRRGVVDYLLMSEPDSVLLSRLEISRHRLDVRPLEMETEPVPAPVTAHAPARSPHRIWWDANLCAIRSDDMWVPLSPIEWKLFEQLVTKRGSIVSTEDLINSALQRSGTTPSDTSLLRLHVSRLRAKLNEHFAQELSIVTMRGRGYMLI